jgi:lipopolysaccharide transport system ATP-binding protein
MKNNNYAIEVKNLSKVYLLDKSHGNYFLRDEISDFFKNIFRKKIKNKTQFYALKDVSFKIKKGETIGIIGPNGAGKSTILKILSRITYPSQGKVVLNGRVASLLEVGTGFNPELTGRENIYLNGSILGMTRREIDDKFQEIVNFSEIGQFLDTPVKKYSSGMYIRLAFSIAAYLEPEILLIDEVLAVGDAKFQAKSLGKIDQVTKDKTRTIVFVSHDLIAIKKICEKCILIDKGKIVKIGPTGSVVDEYLNRLTPENDSDESLSKIPRVGSKKIFLTSIKIKSKDGQTVQYATSGEPLLLSFDYNSFGDFDKVNLAFSIHTRMSEPLILHQSRYTNEYFKVKKGKGKIIFKLDRLPLASGTYLLNYRLEIDGEESDYPLQPFYKIKVIDGDFFKSQVIPLQHSPFLVTGKWDNIRTE